MARAAEILGDRWTLLIVRDLLCGAHHFNELERGLPGISRALLTQRLRQLQRAGIVERSVAPTGRKTSYELTQAGRELKVLMDVLVYWGAKWAFGEPEPTELNPILLLWWMRGRVHHERLPNRRTVIEFNFRETRPDRYWLVLDPADVTVCVKHPGFEIDVVVTAELAAFYQVWFGRITFVDAFREQRIEVDAMPSLIRAFPKWFALSPTVDAVRAANESSRARQIT